MMMALGLQLTAQPRCTLGCKIDGEREGGREQQKERAGRDLAGEAETRMKEKVVKEWRGGRREEGEREGRRERAG